METVIAVVVAIAVTAIVVYFVTSAYHKKVTEAKIGNAEEKAREIIDEAVKTAETKKREAMLEAKEESIRVKNDLDKEAKAIEDAVQQVLTEGYRTVDIMADGCKQVGTTEMGKLICERIK